MSAEKTISIAGENALIVYFADKPSAAISTEIATTVKKLQTYLGATLIDLVPSYASLLVIFDPFKTDHQSVRIAINTAIKDLNKILMHQKQAADRWSHCRFITAVNPAPTCRELPMVQDFL